MQHVDLGERFEQMNIEVELGFTAEQTAREVQRCLNCDIETVFIGHALHRVRRLHRYLPGAVPHHHAQMAKRTICAQRLSAPAVNLDSGCSMLSGRCRKPRRIMVKDEDVCVHCGLCAERCPTAAWDMQKFELFIPYAGRPVNASDLMRTRVNDFAFKLANVNGTGSASANGLLMQAIFRMGIPVSGKNLFPSNIQGLPTWYEIRVNKDGYTARALDYDLMVAMNSQTYARDIREVRAGGYLLYDSTWPLDPALHPRRRDISSAFRSRNCATRISAIRASAF